jgi:BirA family biotin operon repressor/biotin-[acetyl-CoA-carboxylase] ligase
LAIVSALKPFHLNDKLHVKWPNDIVYDEKKLSGSLIEIQAETHGASHAVIGIGVNVNMLEDKESHITQAWTSLRNVAGEYIDRNDVCASLVNHLIQYLQQFEAQGFAPFMEEWMQRDCLMNKLITIQSLNQAIEGRVTGINEQGHLLLTMADGKIRSFSSGDATIVKKPVELLV